MKLLKSKKIKYSIIVSFCLLSVILVFFPDWWMEGSETELIKWYPNFGKIIFFYINYVFDFQFFISAILLFFWLIDNTRIKMLIISFYKKTIDFAAQDVLYKQMFTIDLFFKSLSIVFFIAFSSVLWQLSLVSENGLIPFKEFACLTFNLEGYKSIFNYPSIFWISQSNVFISIVLVISILLSIVSIFWKPKVISFFLMWFSYLSIVTFGRDLFQFPWDTFLVEIGFLAIFAVYFVSNLNRLPYLINIAFLILFFRQWFSMGMTKLVYSDFSWYDFSFMKYYWINQPSPTPLAFYMYQTPVFLQQIFTFLVLVFELLIPALIIFGRKGKIISFFLSLIISCAIQINGNFGFFNLLTIILGFWCLDDKFFGKVRLQEIPKISSINKGMFSTLSLGIITLIISINLMYISFWIIDEKTQKHPANFLNYYIPKKESKMSFLFEFISNFRLVSPHGVFKGIPHERIHIEIFVLTKKEKWIKLKFNKGNDILNFSYSAPIMYRLPFNFFYQSYGFSFNNYLKINKNSKNIPSWMEGLINGLFKQSLELRELIIYPQDEILKIKFVRNKVEMIQPNLLKFTLIDSRIIDKDDKFKTPIFKMKFN